MKRKILLSLLLLFAFKCFSQTELYWITKKLEVADLGNHLGHCSRVLSRTEPRVHSHWQYVSNPSDVDLTLEVFDVNIDGNITYEKDNALGEQYPYTENCTETKYLSHYEEMNFNDTVEEPLDCFSCIDIRLYAVSLPQLVGPEDRICEKEELFPQYIDGNDHDVSTLTWEYLNRFNEWEEIPSYKSRYPLNVSLLDIFGSNWRDKIEGNLQLRFKISKSLIDEVIYSYSIYTIQLTECSPDFEGYYNLKNTSCSYKSDGNISVKLSNNINTSEQLVATFFKEDTVNGDILINQYSTKQLSSANPTVLVLEDLGGGFYGFNWPEDIDYGTYYFRYQVLNEDDTPLKPSVTDPFWYTLVKTPSFEIKQAVNVNFKATHLNDESCFNSGDGKIQLNITSGETSSYKYIIYKVDGTTETLYRNWTTFTGNSTIIEGLEKNKYRIKVQDSKNCYARL